MDNMPDANVVIVVASHVGVDEDGTIGKVRRPQPAPSEDAAVRVPAFSRGGADAP